MANHLEKLVSQLAAKGVLPGVAWLGSAHSLASQLQHVHHTGLPRPRQYAAAAGNGACDLSSTPLGPLMGPHLAPNSGRRSASSSGARLHSVHSAALADNVSDDESRLEPPTFNAQLFPPQYGFAAQQEHQQHHQHHHAGLSSSARSKQHNSHNHHPPHRQSGELHAAHGRRHAASSSGGAAGEADVLSDLVLACRGSGVLRRIMLKYKANMGPEQVANTLLCLQHLALEARRLRGASPGSQRGGSSSSSTALPSHQHADEELAQAAAQRRGASGARAQPRVRATQEFSRATARAAESDGPQDQLVAQMLGELGNMVWHMMGDMNGADLSKLLYSWARLDWHPEQKLLADVATSFVAAANAESAAAATASSSSSADASAHWLAAGLWGLARLGEPFGGPVLALLQQRWRSLLPFWNKQQVADLAWALVAAADESAAAEAVDWQHQQHQQQASAEQLAPLVLGLAERLAERLHHQQQQGASWVPAVGWPEVLLLKDAPVPAPETAAAAAVDGGRAAAGAAACAAAAWRVLQALAAVGVDVSAPTDSRVGEVVAVLTGAMQQQPIRW
ncbi:hypothetical protein COO60DRAFT_769858 [Scenedesmus sp. NREL 46B-D3]|nr:hypothetical protein COO60DRAFT_769858 [Scenedesmus sp. NREL 46B-D3]